MPAPIKAEDIRKLLRAGKKLKPKKNLVSVLLLKKQDVWQLKLKSKKSRQQS